MDYGCSYHICSNQSWFDTYEVDDSGEVVIGDGLVCRVEGTGIIKVKMYDNIVRTLGMVRYIPKLKKNIISVLLTRMVILTRPCEEKS